MRIWKPTFSTLMVFMMCALAFSQAQPSESDADKEKKQKEIEERVIQLLDRSVIEAGMLRLPQNRSIVLAITGDLYWKFDDKRARDLFRSAAAELIIFNQELEKEKRESDDPITQVFDYQPVTRNEVLALVARRDAELALDLLIQTRPARLAEEMLRAGGPDAKQGNAITFDPERRRVRNEIALEQQFALLAADENPDKAVKLIKDSLAQGISNNVLPLLQKLNKKDEKKAADLAGEVIKKLVDSDLSKNEEDLRVAVNFLQYAFKPAATSNTKDKPFVFSEALVKDLAGKVANSFLQPSRSITMAVALNQAMPMLEKFVPEKIGQLKHRQDELQSGLPTEFKDIQRQQRLSDVNSTPEEILALLPKMQNEYEKLAAYQSLSMKITQIDDETRAKKLIDQIPDEKARANALEQFETARIDRSSRGGKLDEARKLISNLTKKKTQIQRLVSLAMDFHKKGGEKDIAVAKDLMKDARALTIEYAETGDDLGDVMEVVRGYAVIEPDIAFKMVEPVIDQLNDYVQASSVIARFNPRDTTFKKGELTLVVNENPWPLFRYISQMKLLGKADLERMNVLAERFLRNDARTIVKLFVLQGFLRDDKTPASPAGTGTMPLILWD